MKELPILCRLACALLLAAPGASVLVAQQDAGEAPNHIPNLEESSQSAEQLPISRNVAPVSVRLILKDGSFQLVRRYEKLADRVRYLSAERGEWEELPSELVDWEATRRWQRDHDADATPEASPAMKRAAELDREEAENRAEESARTPEILPGLKLPDYDGVFALDHFRNQPELVEIKPNELNLNTHQKKGLATLNPMAGAKARLEIEGAHAKIHLHTTSPEFFISVEESARRNDGFSQALMVNTGGARELANRPHGAHSLKSGFALVRVDERQAVRFVGAIHVSLRGEVSQQADVIPAHVADFGGKHWLKITPAAALAPGEYALVEILSAEEMNQSLWDFRIDPTLDENPGAMLPIQK